MSDIGQVRLGQAASTHTDNIQDNYRDSEHNSDNSAPEMETWIKSIQKGISIKRQKIQYRIKAIMADTKTGQNK